MSPNHDVANSPFFVFETPTLSNHSKDWGDESSDVAAGNRGRCSSCGSGSGGGGGSESRARARSPRVRVAGRDGHRSNNDTLPPACYRDHFPRQRQRQQQQQQEQDRSVSPSRRAGAAHGVSASAASAGKRQAKRAASLLYSSLRFAAAVKSETLPPGECLSCGSRIGASLNPLQASPLCGVRRVCCLVSSAPVIARGCTPIRPVFLFREGGVRGIDRGFCTKACTGSTQPQHLSRCFFCHRTRSVVLRALVLRSHYNDTSLLLRRGIFKCLTTTDHAAVIVCALVL